MRNILIFSLLLTACSHPEKSAKKWKKEAKCVDFVRIAPQNRYADIDYLQLKGLTLQDVEKLYGHYNYAPLENAKFDNSETVEDLLLCLPRYFTKSDYPVVISIYDWFRHPKISKMYLKVNEL